MTFHVQSLGHNLGVSGETAILTDIALWLVALGKVRHEVFWFLLGYRNRIGISITTVGSVIFLVLPASLGVLGETRHFQGNGFASTSVLGDEEVATNRMPASTAHATKTVVILLAWLCRHESRQQGDETY